MSGEWRYDGTSFRESPRGVESYWGGRWVTADELERDCGASMRAYFRDALACRDADEARRWRDRVGTRAP